MNINLLENEIEKTAYWDMMILDVQTHYFGDEVDIFIENDGNTCWKISFNSCYKVDYETDANWRGNFKVKDTGPKSGYYAQNISLKRYENDEDFIDCSLDLSIMTINIVCKEIQVEELEMAGNLFFWQDN